MVTAILGVMLAATSAQADASDDYAACLIGRAAVTLHKQARKDSDKALEVAHQLCREPKGVSENELEGISDYASKMVEAMPSGR
ncbi:hypothetical protein [Neorhizobium sp. LjRoot104]|uniref:hypothetical protein n=1 Tax=Neorhizobium sp. LjRoot104 TaxID=3342254 RepID=UPI003ED056E3